MAGRDVIIIGGGHNGLAAAALLAGNGRKVILLERLAVLGGLAVGDEFHPGYTSVGLLHDTSTVCPQLVKRLGLAGMNLREPPPVFAPQVSGKGSGLLLHRDPTQAAGEIEAHSASDARRYADYRNLLERIRPVVSGLFDSEPPTLDGPVRSLWPLAIRGLSLRRLGRHDMMELFRIGPMCLADWLNEWFETELLSCVLAAPALAGTRCGPWSPGTVANLLRLEAMSGPTLAGGPPALIGALERSARDRGVEIRLDAEVRHIRTSNGAVEGVTLSDGESIDAAVVASSCDPRHTILEMLDAESISPGLNHRINKLRCSGTTAKVDLAVRGPLRFACRPDLDIEHARIAETIDGMERAFDATKYGRFSENPILDIYVPTVANPDLAPDDHHVVSIVAHLAPHDLRCGWSDDQRKRLGDSVLDTLGSYVPGLRGQIVGSRVLTPVDIEERYGVSGGHVHHVEHALDQMIVRPAPECAHYATPIDGLYLCGSGSHPGGGLTGGPGRLAAAAILRG